MSPFLSLMTNRLLIPRQPNIGDKTGNTALHRATEEGLRVVADRLLKAGADPTLLNQEGERAAPWAVAGDHLGGNGLR